MPTNAKITFKGIRQMLLADFEQVKNTNRLIYSNIIQEVVFHYLLSEQMEIYTYSNKV